MGFWLIFIIVGLLMSELIKAGLPCKSCTSSDAMAEYDNGFYCFSCKASFSKWNSSGRSSPTNNTKQKFGIKLPVDFTLQLPPIATDYLEQYYISEELAAAHNIGWSNTTQYTNQKTNKITKFGPRIVIPVYKGNSIVSYEAKSLNKHDRIKYVTIGDKKTLYYRKPALLRSRGTIITEDIFSAIRMPKEYDAIALRGTNSNLSTVCTIKKLSKGPYFVWLDGDDPGVVAAAKLRNSLAWFNTTNLITTEKDPKCYSDAEIEEFLNGKSRH